MSSKNAQANLAVNIIGATAYNHEVGTISACLFYGIFVLLWLQCILSLRRSNRKKLIFPVVIFTTTTGVLVTTIGISLQYLSVAKTPILDDTPTWDQRLQLSAESTIPYAVCLCCFEILTFFIGNLVIMWRAVVFWPGSRVVQSFLGFLVVAATVMDVMSNVQFLRIITRDAADFEVPLSLSIAFLIGAILNVSSTVLILIKAFYLRDIIKSIFLRPKGSNVYQTLLLIIECGFLYLVPQILAGVTTVTSANDQSISISSKAEFFYTITGSIPILAGIYPLVVILIIIGKHSVLDKAVVIISSKSQRSDTSESSQINDDSHLSTIVFTTREEVSTARDSDERDRQPPV